MPVLLQGLTSLTDPVDRDIAVDLPGLAGETVRLDARGWLACPSLYDADTFLPLDGGGLRDGDVETALRGGVSTLNCSVDWHRFTDPRERGPLLSLAGCSRLPSVRLLPTAPPDGDNSGFPAWLAGFAGEAADLPVLKACKLYARAPDFARNLEAVWSAGWLAMVFVQDARMVADLAESGGRICFRHATSVDDVAAMRGSRQGTRIATSPQYLLPLPADTRRNLVVRPSPLSDEIRAPFARDVLSLVDVIATDHVAPGATAGPGLRLQQHFLPALLALAEREGLDKAALLDKAGASAAAVFGAEHRDGVAILAPRSAGGTAPEIRDPEREPFSAALFTHEVVAIVSGGSAAATPAFGKFIR
ncbi:hypothetical protein [Labrys monachus]|uniref:Dihydroorotase n=1 Tax=Labrys monachus TaxID=217067 RepID=A0ABU0FK24_9HYPH|nr:hypothetical protein [Labrys monachus]MDQ0394428.1 hypothetical protein [Labrys monachus]